MKVKLCVVCDKPLTRRPGIIKMANGKNRPVESATNFHLRQTCDDACYNGSGQIAYPDQVDSIACPLASTASSGQIAYPDQVDFAPET